MTPKLVRIAQIQNALALRQRHFASRLEMIDARTLAVARTRLDVIAFDQSSPGRQKRLEDTLSHKLAMLAAELKALAEDRQSLLLQWQSGKAAERSAEEIGTALHAAHRRVDDARSIAEWVELRMLPATAPASQP